MGGGGWGGVGEFDGFLGMGVEVMFRSLVNRRN